MPKLVTPLKDAKIKNAKPQDKDYTISAGDGLYLLIKPNGAKWWRFNYVSPIDSKRKLMSFGTYPETTLEAAFAKRLQLRQKIASGIDPMLEKQEQKQAALSVVKIEQLKSENTLEKIGEKWLERKKTILTERSFIRTARILRKDILVHIGDRPIDEITISELLGVIKKIEERGTIDTAHRALRQCGEVWRYAVAHGLTTHNIVADINKRDALMPKIEQKYPAITDPQKVGEFLRAIDSYAGDFMTKQALRLLSLTFCRPSEVTCAKWDEISFERKEWRIPQERMKSRVEHIVPLSSQSIEILQSVHAITGGGVYVFPSAIAKMKPLSNNTLNQAIKRLGYGDEMVAHGFRAMASTLLRENGYFDDLVERQLAHGEKNKAKAAYDRASYLPQRREMMGWWANYLDELRKANQ